MSQAALVDLPPELLLSILDHVHRTPDLKALCLTCRAVKAAAIPKLYETVTLNADKYEYPQLGGFFSPNNSGHEHIHELIFLTSKRTVEYAWKVVNVAIQLVSRGSLRSISFPEQHVLDADVFFNLCLNQRNLDRIAFGPVGSSIADTLRSSALPDNWARSITSIHLPQTVSSLQDIQGYQQLITQAKGLDSLSISICCVSSDTQQEEELSEDMPGRSLVENLFGHVTPYGRHPALRLSNLGLDHTYLGDMTTYYMRVVDFSKLTALVLRDCAGEAKFLKALQMTSTTQGLSLRLFKFTHESHKYDSLPRGELEALLRSFCGLASFYFGYDHWDTQAEEQPDVLAVLSHQASLKTLFFSAAFSASLFGHTVEAFASPNEDMVRLSRAMLELRSVSLALPLVAVQDSEENDWGDFGTQVDALSTLPVLRELSILSWPRAPHGLFAEGATALRSSDQARLQTESYLRMLDSLVTAVFRRISRNRADRTSLRVLRFGFPDTKSTVQEVNGENRSLLVENVGYLLALQTDENGDLRPVAVRKTRKEMQHLFPRSDRMTFDEPGLIRMGSYD